MGIPLLFSSSTVSFKGPNRPVTIGAFFLTSRICVIVDIIPSLSSAFFAVKVPIHPRVRKQTGMIDGCNEVVVREL